MVCSLQQKLYSDMVKRALAVVALISVNGMETLAQETVQGMSMKT